MPLHSQTTAGSLDSRRGLGIMGTEDVRLVTRLFARGGKAVVVVGLSISGPRASLAALSGGF